MKDDTRVVIGHPRRRFEEKLTRHPQVHKQGPSVINTKEDPFAASTDPDHRPSGELQGELLWIGTRNGPCPVDGNIRYRLSGQASSQASDNGFHLGKLWHKGILTSALTPCKATIVQNDAAASFAPAAYVG
jgi:hypothetical protein